MNRTRLAMLTASAAVMSAAPASASLFGEPVLQRIDLSGRVFAEIIDTGGVVPGFGTLDLFVNTEGLGDLTTAQMLLNLTSGSIFQHEAGTHLPPGTLIFDGVPGSFPGLQFDTFVSINGGSASPAGAAGDVGGSTLRFDTEAIDLTWNNTAEDDIGPAIHVARLTLSDDASGTAIFAFTAGGTGVVSEPVTLAFTSGVPEPASLALLGLGGLAALARRRSA